MTTLTITYEVKPLEDGAYVSATAYDMAGSVYLDHSAFVLGARWPADDVDPIQWSRSAYAGEQGIEIDNTDASFFEEFALVEKSVKDIIAAKGSARDYKPRGEA